MTRECDLNRVIEAIDKLRTRKNRPNLPAIAHFLSKSHSFSSDKTINLLDLLLSQNRVKEVIYKGNISYRNMLKWRQPNKSVPKKLDSHVNSSLVVSTMLRLLIEDRESSASEDAGGIAETRLQASLIKQLDGAVTLNEIRKQIQLEVNKGTLEKNHAGDFVLNSRNSRETPGIDLDMDEMSESSESVDARGSSSEVADEDSLMDNGVESTQTSFLNESSDPLNTDESFQNYEDILQNLSRSIDNVVNDVQNTTDSDIMTEPKEELVKKIKGQEITCQLNDINTSGVCDNKRRRVIRKKTIYDPSEFELTPLVRRNRRRGSTTVVTVAGRERGGRGRRGSRGSRSWVVPKDSEPSGDEVVQPTRESLNNGVPQEPPKEKPRCRGKPPAHVNKKCSICSSPSDKNQPNILSCSLCLNIAHKDCVKHDSFYEGSKKWRCDDCKVYNPVVCSSCELESNKKQVMLMCDYCEEFFHADCHYPPVHLPLSESTWRCSSCPAIDKDKHERLKIKYEEEAVDESFKEPEKVCVKSEALSPPSPGITNKTPSPPPSESSYNSTQVSSEDSVDMKSESNHEQSIVFPITIKVSSCVRHKPDEPIPSVDDWTVQQVSDYFLDKFGQDVADAFQAQEIDGKLLMQISRQYVTNDLGLQLGIALKVLYYVKKIQLGTNLLQQLWA